MAGKNDVIENNKIENNEIENNEIEKDVRERKKRMRKKILAERDALTASEREQAERLLTERVLAHPWFVSARQVLGFASYGSEISTDRILEEALRQGKELYLPRVEGEEMRFYRVRELAALTLGYKGIREPAETAERFAYDAYVGLKTADVLVLLPGVAFDASGNRMGYGKGFYDRFLAEVPSLTQTIGVGFACQLVQEVPHEERDVRAGQIICV